MRKERVHSRVSTPRPGETFRWNQYFNRRQFLKGSAAVLATTLGAGSIKTGVQSPGIAYASEQSNGQTVAIPTICENCVWRCGAIAYVRDGVLVKLEGNPEHPNSNGKLCPRGNAGIKVLYDPDRLQFPMIRAGQRGSGLWRRVSWEEALDFTAENMQRIKDRYGPEAMIMSSTHNLTQPYFENLLKAFGTPNYGTQRSLCFNAMTIAFTYTYGLAQPGVDYDNCKYIIYTGRNLAEAISNSETQKMMEFAARGGKIVVLDPRYTVTASKAVEWLPIRPGTDLAFFLALNHVVITEGLYDRQFVDQYCTGFDKFAETVKPYSPEWAARRCEIDAGRIRRIAREFASHRPAAVAHPNWRTSNFINSFQTERAIAILNALMGNWGAPGGLLAGGEESGPSLGSLPQPPYPQVKAPRLDGVPWKYPLVPLKYGVIQEIRDALLTGKPYQGRGWLVYRQNPLMSIPERRKTLTALKNLDFLAVIDILPNDTAYYADVILPESTYLERWDPVAPAGGKLFLRQPVVEPLYDTMSGLMILKELGIRLGLGDYFPYAEEQDVIKAQIKPFNVDFQELVKKGFVEIEEARHRQMEFQTPSGKIEISSSLLESVGEPGVPVWQEPPAPPEGQFYLLTGKVAQHTQFTTQNNQWLMELTPENPLWINATVAKRLGIKQNQRVVVESKVGKVISKAFVSEAIRPDCVFLAAGFGHLSKALTVGYGAGVSNSALHETHTDGVSGGQALSETFVTVRPLTEKEMAAGGETW